MGKMAPNRSQARPRVTMPRTATAKTARNHSNEMMTASMRKATKRLPMMPSNSCGCVTGSKAGDGLLKSMPERGEMVFCSDISPALKGLAFTGRWWLRSDHASEEPPEASSASADHPSAPAFETAHLEAFGLEFADGLQCMRLVLRLDHEIERGPSRGHVEQRAAVEDLENIRPRSAKNGGDPAKHTGLIGDGESKRNDFSVPLEPAHDNGGEHAGIDIAAAEVEAELEAAKLLGLRQQSGKGGGAGTFSDDLLRGEQGADGAFDGWLVHQHDAGDQGFHDRQSKLARCFHRDPICQRLLGANHRFAGEGCMHRRARRRRYPDHGKARLERMQGDGIAGDQASTPNRDNDHVEVGDVL